MGERSRPAAPWRKVGHTCAKSAVSVRQIQPDRAKFLMRSSAACWRHPFECQFLQSGGGLRDVEISFRIGRDLMARSDNARRLNVAHNLQRLAINNVNAIATADIQKLLGWVWR